MKYLSVWGFVLAAFFSSSANAILWRHYTSTYERESVMGMQLSMEDVIGHQLNRLAIVWRAGDIIQVRFNDGVVGKLMFTGNPGAPWTDKIPAGAEAKARADGVIVSEEGSENDVNCPPDRCRRDGSPLLIDLNSDGFVLGAPGSFVSFDLFSVGIKYEMQWVRPNGDEAFLVADLNNNGRIDGGEELFGEGTRKVLQKGIMSKDGYDALIQYDSRQLGGNEDGIIDSKDRVWSRLSLWVDHNADGISTPDELFSLEQKMVNSISLKYKNSNKIDAAGNRLDKWSWVSAGNSANKTRMADIYFAFRR